MEKCIVLHSGGQDSTTCLLLAINQFGKENVYPVGFFYHQTHVVELDQAQRICNLLGVGEKRRVFELGVLNDLGGGALTNTDIGIDTDAAGTGNKYAEAHGLPSTVVPGRNVMFLAVAAAWGAMFDCYNLMTGGCFADYEGYPDCRPEFYSTMEEALVNALDEIRVTILTPLTLKSKAETFQIADELGHLDLVLRETHTCYRGVREWHDWGAGCGECPACITRANGWHEFQAIVGA
jgi:7-cyano-7-deazaguanine synthase